MDDVIVHFVDAGAGGVGVVVEDLVADSWDSGDGNSRPPPDRSCHSRTSSSAMYAPTLCPISVTLTSTFAISVSAVASPPSFPPSPSPPPSRLDLAGPSEKCH